MPNLNKKQHNYTPEEIEFIRENTNKISLVELTKKFNEKFSTDVSYSSISHVRRKHGILTKWQRKKHFHSNASHKFTEKEIEFIRDNISSCLLSEFTKKFNYTFHTNVKPHHIAYIKHKYGIYTQYHPSWIKKGEVLNCKCHRYTPKEIEFIRQNVDGISNEELTKRFNEKFNTNLSKVSILFQKNKFKLKANLCPKPVGAITTRSGEKYIKVGNPNKWRQYKRVLYEKSHGIKLEKNDCIIFLDGNHENFDIDNLEKLPKGSAATIFENMGGESKFTEVTQLRINISKIRAKMNKITDEV